MDEVKDMQDTEKKDLFKILALVLAVIILFIVVIESVLLLTSGSGSNHSGEKTVKTEELKTVLPSGAETKISEKITINATGSSKKTEEEKESDELTDDYIISDSNTKLLTNSDIAGLSAKELNYAKNEIYARHGRKFASQELQRYFESKAWYEGRYDSDDFDANYSAAVLSETEKKNAEFLKNAVEAAGGYQLDQ